MKKFTLFVIAAALCFGCPQSHAEKGASEKAYEHASDRAIFHRVSDWFSTVGKPEEEKEAALVERQAKREAKKAEKSAVKQMKKAEKEARKAGKK